MYAIKYPVLIIALIRIVSLTYGKFVNLSLWLFVQSWLLIIAQLNLNMFIMSHLVILKEQLGNLFFQHTQTRPLSIVPLAESGSARLYFRLSSEKDSYIGAFNPNRSENEAFFSFSETFIKCGLNVPEVVAIHPDKQMYLQTDLGHVSLFEMVEKTVKNEGWNNSIISLYKEILLQLIRYQTEAHLHIDYSKAWPVSHFDKASILGDLNYFKNYFVRLHANIVFNETTLDTEFETLAAQSFQAPNAFFMYRDFQARNILIHENKPWFIDFQGGRMGPLQYDVVSLLYQVKIQMPQPIREMLIAFYCEKLGAISHSFEKYLSPFILLRLLQVFGAYGFRGLIQKKQHFLLSIPLAIVQLEQFLSNDSTADTLPELKQVLKQIVLLKAQYPKIDGSSRNALTIYVNSFSYLKGGIPNDFTGNGGGFVFDCRALPNPGRETAYKMLTGQDEAVIQYLEQHEAVHTFLRNTNNLIESAVKNYLARNFKHLMVNFGCTGGQHRSVYCAEKTAQWLRTSFPNIHIELIHRENTLQT